jgi:alpha-L-fucosidase 2
VKDILIETLVLGCGLAMALTPAAAAWAMDYRAVFTAPPQRIPSDNSLDAPLLGNGDTLAALGGTPDKLQFYINKNDLWIMLAGEGSHPVPLARLELEFPGLKNASYLVEQDLQQAITTGRFTQAGVTLSLETGMAATENLLWIKLSAEGDTLQGRAGLYLPGQNSAATGDVAVVERRFEQDVLVPAGAACAMRVIGGGAEFTVTPGKPVFIVASVCSRFDGLPTGRSDQPAFRQAAVRRATELGPEELARVRTAHVAWWRQFWARSFVEIPDKVLEQRYYLSHYILASASRVPDFPPGLFGWITTDKPSWNGDYHLNYNHVAPFYGLYAANHVEQADPCHVPFLAALNMGHEWSLKHFGITNGVLLPVGIGPKGSLSDANLWGQKSNAGYCCVPLALRWYSTYDLDFGRKAYPFVRDTARFWEESLALENGRYVIYKDAVHEGSGENVNPIQTLGLVKQIMNLVLDMSSELGVDADRRAKWMDIRDRLSDYPTCTVGNLPKEFSPQHLPQNADTWTLPIFRYTEQGPPWWGDNTLGIQHIYPAGGIGLDSKPELLQRARNQIHVMNRWMDFNGMNSFYAAAARVGYDPAVILKEMRNMLERWALPNGMIRDNPHGMEHQSIVPNAIQEMLLQSHEGIIRFFPVWPKDQDARFGALRARGAFLVSAALKGGIVTGVKIVSEKGRACAVQNPWPGKSVRVIRNSKQAESVSGDRFILNTGVGETIEIEPLGA